jgi:DNA polymerase elongation subunit (family B)
LKNRATKSYYNNGCIIGNNVNFNNVKEKFPGAFVSDPRLNTDYSKATLGGRPVMIFDNLNDFDYKSLYPSITSEFNMSPNTIKCKVDIPEQVYEFENRFKRPDIRWNRGAQYMDDLQSHNWIEFFHRWHGFASYQELYDDVLEYFALIGVPFGSIQVHGLDPVYIKKPSEERYGNLFLQLRSDRDKELYDRYENNMGPIEQPEFDFENSDFNSFVEIYESLKSGYKNSRPHTVDIDVLITKCG